MVAVIAMTTTLSWLSLEEERSPQAPDRATVEIEPSTSPPTPLDTESFQAAIDAAVEECRRVWEAQEQPLQAAAISLAQWQVHVDAMNQLVAGEITFAQATAFWEQTRILATDNVTAFTEADGEYVASDPSCPTPVTPDGIAVDTEALAACDEGIEARDETLDAARVSIRTWHHHVIDMDLLRAGQLSPELALELWRRYWRQGVDELNAYREQLGEAKQESCDGA
ncbi:hypothetical protein [Nocardioides gansuensis]|uniref:hypothetical protein n=1 Tax=Nocardioides gansuensis TaxID=2138300 RepID=UPI001057D574|nr:hypothetical protein [Nocardioides gansuensis]